MNIVRVAAAIVGPSGVTLYLEDGKTMLLRSDAFETAAILEAVMPGALKHQIVQIDLDAYSAEQEVERKTGGVLRFFKAVGKAASAIFDRHEVKTTGSYAVPRPSETTVAVINGVEIPGVEKLKSQIDYAARTGNVEGLKRFMERISKVIDKRGHTVQELLHFMERGDLPIADDGTIVAYKMLFDKKDGYFVDPHSRTVRQRVGSMVRMPDSDVDASRRTECSTGLHIARRNYLKGFSGDTIMVVKIQPEDVIAVPHGEADKMRVSAYHVLAKVNDNAFSLLKGNDPMTKDAESAKLLANVIKGNHVAVLETVSITGKGAPKEKKIETVVSEAKVEKVKLEDITATTVEDGVAEAIRPAAVLKRAEEMRQETAAQSGDMSAALVLTDPLPVTPATVKPKKVSKPKFAEKPADPVPAVKIDATKNEKRDVEVLKLLTQGMSQREVERKTGVSARTIRRIIAAHKI